MIEHELDEELIERKGVWEKVPHMFGPNPVCTACGQSPRDESREEQGPLPAYNAVGVDVDWGNHLFICARCADIISELHGCLPADDVTKLRRRLKLREQRVSELEKKLDEQQVLIDRVMAGARARKELKDANDS